MDDERHGIEQVRYVVDRFRAVGFVAFFVFVGGAAIYAGGWQGWALAGVFLLLALNMARLLWVRRADKY